MRIPTGLAERIDYQVPVLLPARLPCANALSPRHNVGHVIRPHVRAQIKPSLMPRPGDESTTPRATLHIRLHLGPKLRAITGLFAVTDLAAGNIHHARANRLRSHYSPSKGKASRGRHKPFQRDNKESISRHGQRRHASTHRNIPSAVLCPDNTHRVSGGDDSGVHVIL